MEGRMFFRREKPKTPTFQERLDTLRSLGFTVESAPSGGSRVSRNGCAAVLEDKAGSYPHVNKSGIIIGDELGFMVNGGYQMFFRTPSGRTVPAIASQLHALHEFEEDLKEALGLTSLYNESLGTTADQHLYDRVVSRDKGVPARPWDRKQEPLSH
jgi:hypothetical protein